MAGSAAGPTTTPCRAGFRSTSDRHRHGLPGASGARTPALSGAPRGLFAAVAFGWLALGASGCSTVHYLYQAGKGQLQLVNRARPIPQVIRDERTPPRLRALLAEIEPIKKYGEVQGIRPTTNYTDYVRLDRQAAVWVVSACEPLKFVPKEWRFPVVGGFPYLGWFDLEDARAYAAELRATGLDVDLRGASAYSTLGWFKDAVLSTMVPDGPEALAELVNVILHESVHATVYIKGQAFFNESLASFVADRLTIAYLTQTRGAASPELVTYERLEKDSRQRARAMHEAYGRLDTLYASGLPDSRKREAKAELLAELKAKVGFRREINNATLIQYKEYNDGTADYADLLQACAGDWHRFLGAVGKLKPGSFATPQQESLGSVLGPLARAGCTA